MLIDTSLNCSRLGAGFPFPEALAQCTTFLYGLTELFLYDRLPVFPRIPSRAHFVFHLHTN